MPVPPEYTEAITNLKAFRTKILNDLVGARIIAGLNASHDSMQKYKDKIDGLSITPYLFGRIREYALALKFKGMDLDIGEIRRIGASWTGNVTDYPLNPPYNIPQRPLMPVDVFAYTPVTDIDLLDKMSQANLKSYIVLQCPHDTFNETPDIENASYEYYCFFPVQKYRGGWVLTNPFSTFVAYHHLKGERTLMWLQLTEKSSGDVVDFLVNVWLDAIVHNDSADEFGVPVTWETSTTKEVANTILVVAGHRSPHAYLGLWVGGFAKGQQPWAYQNLLVSEWRVADGWTLDIGGETEVWKNTFDVSVTVNDLSMGDTNPVSGTEDKRVFGTDWNITAIPKAGYTVDHWKRNGTNVGGGLTYSHTVRRDESVYCVFKPM